jgi:N4-gp56 family major capsid protein
MKEIFEINLQLFADIPVQTTNSDNGGNLTAEMKTFYSKDLIETLGANLVFLQFGDKVALPKNGGKTIEWRRWAKFDKALKPLQEGVVPNGTPISVETVVAKINQFGGWTPISDLLELTAIDNVILETTEKHADNARLTIDTVVRNKLACGTNVLYADNIASGNAVKTETRGDLTKDCKLTPDMVARAAATLKKANAPKIDGAYMCTIHPSVSYDLMRNEEWIDVNKYSNATAIYNGEIGKLYGVRFVESTEAPIFKGTDLATGVERLTVTKAEGEVLTVNTSLSASQAEELAGKVVELTSSDTVETAVVRDVQGNKVILDKAPTVAPTAIAPYGGGADNCAVYGCFFFGKGAYKVVSLDEKNVEVFVKGRGSAGSADPIDQISTVGWKAVGFGAEIAIPEYIVRVECGSFFSNEDQAN